MLRNYSPYTLIILSFIGLIFIGAVLLMMPFSHIEGSSFSFFEALFTATSAVTVTGLSITDIHHTLSPTGEIIILLLIQFGGLGILTFSSVIMLLIAKKIGFYTKRIVAEGLNHEAKIDLYSHIKKVVVVVLTFEAIGSLLLFCAFIREYSIGKALFYAIFHSVSSFCNAGISLYPNSLQGYTSDIFMNLVIAFLIIFGGLGFTAIIELYEFALGKRQKISVNSRFSMLITGILLLSGTLLFFGLEYNRAGTLSSMPVTEKLLVSFFHSTSLRTAGFSTIPIANISAATVLLCTSFMFIGASPNSTGSGVKTTTFGILYLGVKASLLNRRYIEFSRRRISWQLFNRASALVFIAFLYILTITLLMCCFEPNIDFIKILFEVMSAFSTSGLSMGITDSLSRPSQVILLLTMFLGRVGPLTIALALSRDRRKGNYKYPKENILIG